MGEQHALWYGQMTIEPYMAVKAGSYHQFLLTYTAGRYGIDNGGRLRLLFRFAWDGGTPQFSDPRADNYVSATTSNPKARVTFTFMPKGGRRPWLPCVVLEVKDDSLDEGDQIYIRFGDTSQGSKGHVVQTFAESDFCWLTDVESFETGTWVELDNCPVTPVVAADVKNLAILSPSLRSVHEPFDLVVKAIDAYGNPSSAYGERVRVQLQEWLDGRFEACADDVWEGLRECDFAKGEVGVLGGTHRLRDVRLKRAGQYRFVAQEMGDDAMTAFSNMLTVEGERGEVTLHWGDLHGQYNNALGAGSVAEAFRYARDAGHAEFVGHQPNDFQFRAQGWEEAKQAVKDYHAPGQFLPFLGYEWSGNTPAGGDRNVHFLHDDGPLHRSSHWHIPDKSDISMDRYPLDELYKTFRGRGDVLLLPHIGGRRCNIEKYWDPELEPVLEICSCHGRFEWLLHEALMKGYVVGVVGGSDDHTGRPGAAYATSHSFGTRGGLAGIYAAELTREGVFAALKARHTYATTGERIWLHVGTGDGKMMGDHFEADEAPELRIRVAGTSPLERVEIMRNLELAYTLPMFEGVAAVPNQVRLEWGGARVKGRGRHSTWDGKVTVDGASIVSAETFAFDHPKQGIVSKDDHAVAWISTTSGDHDGIVLTLSDHTDDTVIHFQTAIASVRFTMKELRAGAVHRDCGEVDQYCRFSMPPVNKGPVSADFTWKDESPADGRNAYWLRVVQADGEMAWSSPMYVEVK